MNTLPQELIKKISFFLDINEIFYFSSVNKYNHKNLKEQKEINILEIKDEIQMAHYSNNTCACILNHICPCLVQKCIKHFQLRLMICQSLNKEYTPPWFEKIMEYKK